MVYSGSIDAEVAKKVGEITEGEEYSPETLKALCVVVRTNLINEEITNTSYAKEDEVDQTLLKYSKETSNEYLKDAGSEDILTQKIEITKTAESKQIDETWIKEIKKVEILEFLNNNNISLASIKNVEPIFSEEGECLSLVVGGKEIPFKIIKEEFNLPSSHIINIDNNISSIIVEGKPDKNKQVFDLFQAETLAQEKNSYKIILKYLKNDFFIITNG